MRYFPVSTLVESKVHVRKRVDIPLRVGNFQNYPWFPEAKPICLKQIPTRLVITSAYIIMDR